MLHCSLNFAENIFSRMHKRDMYIYMYVRMYVAERLPNHVMQCIYMYVHVCSRKTSESCDACIYMYAVFPLKGERGALPPPPLSPSQKLQRA